MAAVFLHYEQGSAPFTCKIKTELGLAEALEKFRTKYRKKHGREPPPLEARGPNDATGAPCPPRPTSSSRRQDATPERPPPKTAAPAAGTAKPAPPRCQNRQSHHHQRNGPAGGCRAAPEAGGETNKREVLPLRTGVYEALLQAGATERATRGLATVDLKEARPPTPEMSEASGRPTRN